MRFEDENRSLSTGCDLIVSGYHETSGILLLVYWNCELCSVLGTACQSKGIEIQNLDQRDKGLDFEQDNVNELR